MKKTRIQEINAGSMADIAFLLLIFFLVTTTMSSDLGIVRKLPPMVEDNIVQNIRDRDLLNVRVNRANQIMVDGRLINLSELNEITKEFIQNPKNSLKLPERKLKDIEGIGKIEITSGHVISLMNDRGTSYKTYVAVQNELAKAYNELRQELALELWNKEYGDLGKKRKAAIDKVYGMKISEAEPMNVASVD